MGIFCGGTILCLLRVGNKNTVTLLTVWITGQRREAPLRPGVEWRWRERTVQRRWDSSWILGWGRVQVVPIGFCLPWAF